MEFAAPLDDFDEGSLAGFQFGKFRFIVRILTVEGKLEVIDFGLGKTVLEALLAGAFP